MIESCLQRLALRGATLTETTAVVGILSVLMATAASALPDWLHHSRLRGAADSMAMALRQMMAESLVRHTPMSLSFQASLAGADWCYGLRFREPCDCRQSGSCEVDGADRVTRGSEFGGVRMAVGVSGGRFSTQPLRSTVTAGNVLFTAANGKQLKVVVTGLGRVRTCSPSGPTYLPGHPTC
jgi:type IV fimbrial biogenesis protein FimT